MCRVCGETGRFEQPRMTDGVGFVLLDLDENLDELPDRAGLVDEHWRGSKG